MKKTTIAIIGWEREGSWGNFFKNLLEEMGGYKLMLKDRASGPTLEVIKEKADIIIVGVPLLSMDRMIRRIGILRENQLLISLASRQKKLVHPMITSKAEAAWFHALGAAPKKGKTMKGRTASITTHLEKGSKNEKHWRKILKATQAKIQVRQSEDHDLAMDFHQVMEYVMQMMRAVGVEKIGIPKRDIALLRTTLSAKSLAGMGRMFLNGTPQIYPSIIRYNLEASENVFNILEAALEEVRSLCIGNRKKTAEFEGRFEDLRDHIGEDVLRELVKGEFHD